MLFPEDEDAAAELLLGVDLVATAEDLVSFFVLVEVGVDGGGGADFEAGSFCGCAPVVAAARRELFRFVGGEVAAVDALLVDDEEVLLLLLLLLLFETFSFFVGGSTFSFLSFSSSSSSVSSSVAEEVGSVNFLFLLFAVACDDGDSAAEVFLLALLAALVLMAAVKS